MPTRRITLGFLAALIAAPALGQTVTMPAGTKLIVLRHSDRAGENLNERGIERSKALIGAVSGMQIDHIFAPSIQRNLDTAAPLAAARGMKVEAIAASRPAADLMDQGGGKTIMWIGNKGNLRSIWRDMDLPDPAPLEYGDIYILEPNKKITRRRFGE